MFFLMISLRYNVDPSVPSCILFLLVEFINIKYFASVLFLFFFFFFFSWNKEVLYPIGVKEVVETMIYHSSAGSTGAICDSETVVKLLHPVAYCSSD